MEGRKGRERGVGGRHTTGHIALGDRRGVVVGEGRQDIALVPLLNMYSSSLWRDHHKVCAERVSPKQWSHQRVGGRAARGGCMTHLVVNSTANWVVCLDRSNEVGRNHLGTCAWGGGGEWGC